MILRPALRANVITRPTSLFVSIAHIHVNRVSSPRLRILPTETLENSTLVKRNHNISSTTFIKPFYIVYLCYRYSGTLYTQGTMAGYEPKPWDSNSCFSYLSLRSFILIVVVSHTCVLFVSTINPGRPSFGPFRNSKGHFGQIFARSVLVDSWLCALCTTL